MSVRFQLKLVLAVASIFAIAASAHAGPRLTALQRKIAGTSTYRRIFGAPKGPRVLGVAPHEMTLTVPNQPVWAAFGKNDAKGAAKTLSIALGRQLAKRGFLLATGGGQGLPKDTEDGAYAAGGSTIAFSPKRDLESHSASHGGNINQTTHLVPTGTGGGPGTIAREGPMAQAANFGVASYANGGPGTFGELAAMLHNDAGVLVFLKGTGGVADAAPGWMSWVDAKPSFKVVAGADAKVLASEAARELSLLRAQQPSGRGTRSLALVSPGKARQILGERDTSDRSVAAFLTEDPRASDADQQRAGELVSLWAKESKALTGHPATLVLPASGRVGTERLDALADETGARAIVVSPQGSAPAKPGSAAVRPVGLGYGAAEMGNFAAAREVTQDAAVLFFSSARYNNLPALAYSLRDDRQPLIAILANTSTHGDKLAQMISVIDPKAAARVVVENSPRALVEKVAARLREREEVHVGAETKGGLD